MPLPQVSTVSAAQRPLAKVIPITRAPVPVDHHDLDHPLHADEECEQARLAQPLIARLYLLAQESGPAAWQTVRAIDHWHIRHARRWADDERAA